MEKEINRHLESLEDMEEKIDIEIDSMFLNLDIQEIMEDPVIALGQFVEALDTILDDKYHDEALKEGIRFANAIRGKDVI